MGEGYVHKAHSRVLAVLNLCTMIRGESMSPLQTRGQLYNLGRAAIGHRRMLPNL